MMPATIGRSWRWLLHRLLGSSTRFVYGRRYGIELPDSSFDHRRADRILSFLLAERLAERRHLHRIFRPASLRSLRRVHTDDYLESLQIRGALTGILGFEVSDEQHDRYLVSHREQVAGTMLAVRRAITGGGVVVNLGGGFHHALAERGQGFCVFNDVAVAIAERRAARFEGRVLVVDLDLHDGDGTRRIFADDSTVHTFSIHNRHLAPTEATASTSIALGADVEDETYLQSLRETLPPVVAASRPALSFFLAGCDPARDDRMGDWRIGEGALLERDRFVIDLLRRGERRVPTVVLLAGGYGQQAWRYSARFLSTLVHTGRVVEPPETGRLKLAHFRRVARLLTPAELTREPTSDSWQLTDQDVDPAAATRVRSTRFLGFYSRHGIELALERTGVLDALRRRGYDDLRVELQLDNPVEHTLRILSDRWGESLVEIRGRRDERTIEGMSLLWLEWLLLQHPAAEFTPERPCLPGQRYPGLGLLRDFAAMLVVMCERLELDGLALVPSHYHIAAQTRSHFHFVEPEAQARFMKLREALADLKLIEAVQAIDEGRVRDRTSGEVFRWQPATLVLPVSQRLKTALDTNDYRVRVAAIESRIHYELTA
jgi:acetoin utilization deacetylase AcuC-like enzyme